MIAKSLNAHIDNFRDNVLKVNSMIVNNEEVHIYIDGNYKINYQGFTLYDDKTDLDKVKSLVVVTNKKDINKMLNKDIENLNEKIIKVIPKDIVIGIGCKKNTDSDHMKNSLLKFLDEYNIDIHKDDEVIVIREKWIIYMKNLSGLKKMWEFTLYQIQWPIY